MINVSYSFLLLNARSVVNKWDIIKAELLSQMSVQIFAITKTWLGDLNSDTYLVLPDFVFFRSDRKNRRAVGAALLIHKCLQPAEISIPAITLKSNEVNIIMCTLYSTSIKCKAVRICVLYIPPTTPVTDLRQVRSALFYLEDKF